MARKVGSLCAVALTTALLLGSLAAFSMTTDLPKMVRLSPFADNAAIINDENNTTSNNTNTTSNETPTTSMAGPLNSYYNTTSIQVPFQVTDQGMGFAYVELYYRLHDDPWTQYTTASNPDGHFKKSPISFQASEDGQYDFYTLAMDDSGNLEADRGTVYVSTLVDTVAPVSAIMRTGGNGNGDWFNSSVTVSFNATDDGSGVSQTIYRINNGDWISYSGSLLFSDEGNHSIDFYSIDKAGNVESVKNSNVDIDLSTPKLDFNTEEGAVFTSSNVMIAWSMSDSQSNISAIELSVDGGEFTPLGSGAYLCTISDLSSGTHSIILRIVDEAGNSAEKSLGFTVDIVSRAPSADLSMNPVYALVVGAVAVVGAAYLLRPAIIKSKRSKKGP